MKTRLVGAMLFMALGFLNDPATAGRAGVAIYEPS